MGRQRSGSAFCAYGTVIYETTCRSDVRPTIFKRALEGGCKGEPGLRNSDGFPLALPKDYSPSGSILSVRTVPFLSYS